MSHFANFGRGVATRARVGLTTGLVACVAVALGGCGDSRKTGSVAQREDIPAAFDTAARTLSAEGYQLASCIAVADDKQKLACYAALGFKTSDDIPKIEALASAADIMAGKRWLISAPSPGGSDSFQGMATLTLGELPNSSPIAFRNTQIILRCPAQWGGPSNQQWSGSIDLPSDVAYDSNSKQRGTMTVKVDGKSFDAVQFSRSSFNIAADQAVAFRDAVIAGKTLDASVKTVDGKTGSMQTTLPDSGGGLKGYFAKFCA
ncbi:hypothetical protein ACSBM8_06245 [Sphingomonas sp. ASY06-1R]|uniref:hypothetical protein n=1 Tax=Sphingomonas sp. ASY06-1R TaxID=3445771 RepID=UPI003FA21054